MTESRFGRSAQTVLNAMSRRSALRRLGSGGLAAGALLNAVPASQAQTVVSPEATAAAARRALAAINGVLAGGDVGGLDAAFTPEYVNHTPRRSWQTGKLFSPDLPGLKAALEELRTAVPDAVLVIDDVIASADRAAARLTFRGTLDTATIGLPDVADQALNVGAAFFAKVTGDAVSESWDYDDALDLFGIAAAASQPAAEDEQAAAAGKGEMREIKDVHQVALHGAGTLHIAQGDVESLSIEAEPKVVSRIETTVKDGKLTIQPDRSFKTREPIDYWLAVKQLDSIELSGAGNVEADALSAESFRLAVDGASVVNIGKLTATDLAVTASGNANTTLAGEVDSQTVSLSGAGSYSAADLASRIASVTVDGAGKATVRVSESLDAQVSGVGVIEYIGDPTVNQSIRGVGRVAKVG